MSQCDNNHSSENLLEQVRLLYTGLAQHPDNDFGWGKAKENARTLSYGEEWLNHLPGMNGHSSGKPFIQKIIRIRPLKQS